ncbi:hypothetical protein ACHAP5_011388 [Fusarium lateritium]
MSDALPNTLPDLQAALHSATLYRQALRQLRRDQLHKIDHCEDSLDYNIGLWTRLRVANDEATGIVEHNTEVQEELFEARDVLGIIEKNLIENEAEIGKLSMEFARLLLLAGTG